MSNNRLNQNKTVKIEKYKGNQSREKYFNHLKKCQNINIF